MAEPIQPAAKTELLCPRCRRNRWRVWYTPHPTGRYPATLVCAECWDKSFDVEIQF